MAGETIKNVVAIANELKDGAAADIWFDAKGPDDEGHARTIETTQNAMGDAARLLPLMAAALDRLSGFAAHMALKHGINGDNGLTMQEHEMYQGASEGVVDLLEELNRPIEPEAEPAPEAPNP